MSVQCDTCAKPINAGNDKVFCFGGCGQVQHVKCANLTSAGITALRENGCIKYVCHDCRKKQACLSKMMGKCDEMLEVMNGIKVRVDEIESNCERNNMHDAIKKCEQNLKSYIRETIRAQISQLKGSSLRADKSAVQKTIEAAVGEGLANSGGNPSSSYAAVVSEKSILVNDSVLRSGRVRNKSVVSTPKSSGNGHGFNNLQRNVAVENSANEEDGRSSKTILECMVRIKPAAQQTNQQTKTEVRNKINPSQMGIKSVRNGVNGAIVVECGTKTEAEGLLNKLKDELGENYETKIEQPKKPRIKIMGVSDEYDSDDLIDFLKRQNDIEDVQFLRVLKTIKHRRAVCTEFTLICETDPSTFEQIMRKGKLYIDLDRCRVTESVDILRCFKCCGYGHKSLLCRNKVYCARCTGDHDIKECSSEQVKCVNCTFYNNERKTRLDVNHTAWSFDCPVYLKKLQISKQYISYDK